MKEPKRNKKNQYLFFVTPEGESLFAALISPDTEFNPEGIYKTFLKMDASDPEAEELKEYIDEETEKAFKEQHNEASAKVKKKMTRHYPYEMEEDDEGNETGKMLFKFSNKAEFEDEKTGRKISLKPKLFNKYGKKFDETDVPFIGNGSIIQVSGYMKPYCMTSTGLTGVSLKINAVLIKELVESGGSAEAFGFDTEDPEEDEWTSQNEEDTEDDDNEDF